jgi:hypothetical protein
MSSYFPVHPAGLLRQLGGLSSADLSRTSRHVLVLLTYASRLSVSCFLNTYLTVFYVYLSPFSWAHLALGSLNPILSSSVHGASPLQELCRFQTPAPPQLPHLAPGVQPLKLEM